MENTGNDEKPKRPERVRRTKSGPQIYGQDSTGGFEDSQGVIRKDIPARSSQKEDQDIKMSYEPVDSPEEEARPLTAAAQEPQAKQAAPAQPGVSPDGMAQSVSAESAGETGPVRERPAGTKEQEAPQEKQVRKAKPHGQKKSGKVTRLMEASRRAVRSPLLILVAIFQTVYLVGGVAAVFMRELSYGQFAKLIASAGTPDQLSGYMDLFQDAMHSLDTGAVWAALAIRLPDLFLCIGLWVLIITVRRAKEHMSGVGYFFTRLYIVLHMIVACVLLLAVLVLSVTLVIASWSAGTLMAFAIGVLVAAIIVTMVIIMYYFCYLGTVKAVQMNTSRGDFYGRVSIFVAVVQIISGLIGIVSILSGIVNSEITGILTGAGRIGWMVLAGIWIICYRRVMKPYEE